MEKENPCRNCVAPKRCAGCHSKCKAYIEWNEEHQKEKERIRQQESLARYEINRAEENKMKYRRY